MALRRMEAYLAALPDGLAAHPECQQKASITRHVLQHFLRGALPPLPAPLLVRCFATAQEAIVEGSGGRDVRVELRGHTATRADFDAFWS